MSGSNLLIIFSGSIACFKACDVVSRLVQRDYKVRTVMTAGARRFVGAATLEGLTGEPVRHDLFAATAALDLIELARWADLILVCPATAHSINRFAADLADDLACALQLTRERSKPLIIAPAMNLAMWSHPATQDSVARLTDWGAQFLPVGIGRTACCDEGAGRLADPGLIVATVEAALARPTRRLRVLATSGGTAELVDGVRVLTNTSNARTGTTLAAQFAQCGHEVVLLRAHHAVPAGPLCRVKLFSTFADLDAALTRLLGAQHFDAVIHAAAVSDFGVSGIIADGVVQSPGQMKIDSTQLLQLEPRPHPKLVGQRRTRSRNTALKVSAFKLSKGADEAAVQFSVRSLFGRGVDLVVHNDLASRGDHVDAFPASLRAPDGSVVARCA